MSTVIPSKESCVNVFHIYVMIGLPNMRRAFTPVNELKPLDVKMMLSEIQIERKRISLGEVLMEGMKNKVSLF